MSILLKKMANKYENRRVRMTKSLIKNALLELLEQYELSNITVTAVCDTADIHRSTFYKYYTDTADLLKEIEQDYLDQIPRVPSGLPREQVLKESTAFFDFVKQNGKTFRILLGESTGSGFTARLVEFLCSGYIPVPVDNDDLLAKHMQIYIANGTVGMLKEWIWDNFPSSSEKIAEMIYFLTMKVIS